MSRQWLPLCVAGLVVCAAVPVSADYYDSFTDGQYREDPNVWDIDDPCWMIMDLIGDLFVADANNGEFRLYVNSVYQPYGFIGGLVDAGDVDPNTSETFWDATQSHYILTKVRNRGWKIDPNQDTGWVTVMLHTNYVYWQTFWVCYEFTDDRAWNGGYFSIQAQDGTDGKRLKAKTIRGWQPPAGDPNYEDPNLMWADPNYMDEHNGFWICLQFQVVDANFPISDPNGKWLKAACWNGDKFAWDGVWTLEADLGHPELFRDNPSGWWPDRYWTSGVCGVSALIGLGEIPPADAAFDDIEVRTGVFTNVGRRVTLNTVKPNYGSVTVDPDLRDPTDPNTADQRIYRYTDGTQIVLSATPVSGKAFGGWAVWDDPAKYPDPNFITVSDSNTVLHLAADKDYLVEATFKCGSGIEPLLLIGMAVLALGVMARRYV